MARTTELSEQMKEERRQKILSGALKLFALYGLAATKISDIAKGTGMSQGLVYHYFSNKEEIFTELISYAFSRLMEACRILEQMDAAPDEKISIAVKELLDGLINNTDNAYYHQIIAQATANRGTPDKAQKIIRKYNKVPYQIIEKIMEEGQKLGVIKRDDPNDQAKLFWTIINGFALHRFSHGNSARFTDYSIIHNIFIKQSAGEK